MHNRSFRHFLNAAAALVLGLMLMSPVAANNAPGEVWNFDVFLDNREIGYHRFELRELERGQLLSSEADFKVKFLFITAFDYAHQNSELWQNGCLKSIDARTESNGKLFEVLGKTEGEQFVIETESGQATVAECVATFAYWDRDLLERGRLLNPQTGEYLDVKLAELPDADLEIGDQRVQTEKVQLSAKGLNLVVSYSARTGEWLGLDSTLDNGRTLRYRRKPAELGRAGPAALSANPVAEEQ